MSMLTEEQRRRIEESRQRAIELRTQSQAKAKSLPEPRSTTVFNSIPALQSNPSLSRLNNYAAGQPGVSVRSQQQLEFNKLNINKNGTAATGSLPTASRNGAHSQPPIFAGPIVTGVCKLMSRDRFVVEMGYHSELVKLFKNIPGSKYDPSSKKWNFPVQEHNAVIGAVDSMKPQATVGPLPSYILRTFRNAETDTKIPECDWSRIDPVLVRTLLPFQKEGVNFGISRGGRVLIADDMGLGKTIQALGIAHYYYSEWPLLVVTPSSMRYTWREAVWNWLPSVPAGSVVVVESKQDYICDAKVLILSYDLLQRRADEPPVKNCKVIIMDESHHLKNYKAARSRAAIPLLQNSKRSILLSGTPALSRPMELYNQIVSINRNLFPNVNDYIMRYCNGKKTAWGYDSKGASNMEELQLLLRETLMIRRMKSEVLNQLPSKRRQVVILEPSLVRVKSNKGLLNTANAFAVEKKDKHGKLLEYFNETGKAKLDAVKNYVRDLVENGKKFLLFAHHRIVLDGVCETLVESKIKYIRIDGQIAAEERQRLCNLFQFSDDHLVAVLSLTAANSGITLTAASLVVFAELYWNPGELVQAEDRIHRIGQQVGVVVQYLIAKGTADDALWTMILDKLDVLKKAGLSKDDFRDASFRSVPHQLPSSSGCENQGQEVSSQKQKAINDYFKPVSSSQLTRLENNNDLLEDDSITNEDLELAAMLDDLPEHEFSVSGMDDDIFVPDDSLDALLMNQSIPDDASENEPSFKSSTAAPPKKFRSNV